MFKSRVFLCVLFVFVVVVAILFVQALYTIALYIVFIGGLLLFLSFFAFAITASSTSQGGSGNSLPHQGGAFIVPRSVGEALMVFNDTDFEYFSAAVVMALGRGHRFHYRCGGGGDHGTDVLMINEQNLKVVVQSKFFAADTLVTPHHVRDFSTSITLYHAAYGYFVTTSTFTNQAKQTISMLNGRIRPIDRHQLESILRQHPREVELAWRHILANKERTVLDALPSHVW